MSLNHKRRIFRSNPRPLQWRDRGLPSLGVLLAAAGGLTTIVATVGLFVQSSDAPARAPATLHLSAAIGRLAVLDGNTLLLGEQVVQLEGITAPARGSLCHGNGAVDLDCGTASANALASLLRGNGVDCAIQGHDNNGRPVGNCTAGDTSLNQALVLDGWARAANVSLLPAEAAARNAGRGIWRTRY